MIRDPGDIVPLSNWAARGNWTANEAGCGEGDLTLWTNGERVPCVILERRFRRQRSLRVL